jgi:hypothetical protein
MLTADGEVYVLPVKYQDELRHFSIDKVSSLHAQYEVSQIRAVLLNLDLY